MVQYNLANAVMLRLARVVDRAALTAIMTGVRLQLDTMDNAQSVRHCFAKSDRRFHRELPTKPTNSPGNLSIRIERMVHGNVKVCSIDSDFVHGADYKVLADAANTFKGLLGEGAFIRRRRRPHEESSVTDFHQAMTWLREEAERGVSGNSATKVGRNEPRPTLGNHGYNRPPPTQSTNRRRDRCRPDLYHADGRRRLNHVVLSLRECFAGLGILMFDDSRWIINDYRLFAGAGGLSLGAARAGFQLASAVELDPFAIETHKRIFRIQFTLLKMFQFLLALVC